MKLKQFRMTSLILALSFAICMHLLPTPTYAATLEDSMVVGSLTNPGDTATYDLQIDHALYPEAILHVFAYGEGTGNAIIKVYNEEGALVTGTLLRNKLDDKVANTST